MPEQQYHLQAEYNYTSSKDAFIATSSDDTKNFELLLAFTSSIGSLLFTHCFHVSASKALKCIETISKLMELDSGKNLFSLKGNCTSTRMTEDEACDDEYDLRESGKTNCCNQRKISTLGLISLCFSGIMAILLVLLVSTGQSISPLGCSTIQFECSLGADRQQVAIVQQGQGYSLSTGCKLEATAKEVLEKCLALLAPGSGYGTKHSSISFASDYNYTSFESWQGGKRQLILSNNNTSYSKIQARYATAGHTQSGGGLNIPAIKNILDWNSVVYSSSSSRTSLENKLATLLAEFDNANKEVMEAWDAETDPSLKSFQELVVDGSEPDVSLEARFRNWRGDEEVISTRVPWSEIASAADAIHLVDYDELQDANEEEKVQDFRSRSRNLQRAKPLIINNKISYYHSLSAKAKYSVEYTVQVKVGSRKSSASKDTITIQMIGSQGVATGFVTLGNAWRVGEERSVVLSGLREVGAVLKLTVTSSGKDGVEFEEIKVSHTENPNLIQIDNNAPAMKTLGNSEAEAASLHFGSKSAGKKLDVGALVSIKTGKYKGCKGTVSNFSPTTGRPQVCRDCSMDSSSGVSCCATSSCWYYATDQVSMVAQTSPEARDDHSNDVSKLATDPTRIQKGNSVTILSGKYTGCAGTVATFSATTSKPKVCRSCNSVGSNGQSCCGSTKRTKCSYYDEDNLKCTDCERTAAPVVDTGSKPLVKHSSFFYLRSYLKCSGSKRTGTWSCSETLDATRSKSDIQEPPTNSKTGCPKPGDRDWQGDARVIQSSFNEDDLIALEYSFGKLWMSPNARGAARFEYIARADCGSFDRHGSFKVDRKHRAIQQTTGRAYPKYCLAPLRDGKPWSLDGLNSAKIKKQCSKYVGYDRGHLIPANHFDHDKKIIAETNMMVNILPQASQMNRGAFLYTENLVECLREEEVLTVLGGAVYPSSPESSVEAEYFRKTHGVVTPTHFWKVIAAKPDGRYKSDNGLIAFWIPNSDEAVAARTKDYVVSISELEEKLAERRVFAGGKGWPSHSPREIFDLPQQVKDHKPNFWGMLEGCDRS